MDLFGGDFGNLGELGQTFGGPRAPSFGPNQQVGQDPFSQLITGGLSSQIGAGGGPTTDFGRDTQGSISDLQARGGELDQSVVNQRLETAQEGLNRLESSRLENLEGRLADRGLINSGAQKGGIEGVSRDIAEIGAGAFRDILSSEQEQANQRFNTGASLAAGLSAQQPRNQLAALTAGTGRQDILSRIALDTLRNQQDDSLNRGRFGLDVDVANAAQANTEIQQMMSLIQAMFGVPQISRGGFF